MQVEVMLFFKCLLLPLMCLGKVLSGDMHDIFQDNAYLKHERFHDVQETPGIKNILIYTNLFGKSEWPNLRAEDGDTYLKKFGCPVTNCHLEYRKEENQLQNADIVVFHERDMPDMLTLKHLSDNERPKSQLWVYFTGESPANALVDISLYDDIFDWTMTYKHTSDIWVPYARSYTTKKRKYKENIDYAKGKTKLVAWIVSQCGKLRDSVAHELDHILPVHVAGQCSSSFPNRFNCEDHFCENQLRNFKFYLAFENSHCEEYVTEKYWQKSIRSGVVPVVLGGGPYNNPHVAIPGSYINALDFKTVADLGKYLKYLDKNDTAYNEYFKWREHYELWKPVCDWPFEPYWACEICVHLNKGVKHRQRVKMSEFWSVHKNCRGNEIEELLRKSGHDPSRFVEKYENTFGRVSKELDYEEEKQHQPEIQENNNEGETSMNEDVYNFERLKQEVRSLEDSASESYVIIFIFSFSIVGLFVFLYRRLAGIKVC